MDFVLSGYLVRLVFSVFFEGSISAKMAKKMPPDNQAAFL
ncbi:hypothetical protein SVI_3130 [Shewanella violacea DSS12]|uniref:Uncharacterized protein n=1 Tax=Shewanella violacea (strain JCM 10179 / CIP 106290 / LMG 19151 / DSS12) TaxID=637905 RepID=D4ZAQ6_SHEVD|nr:hypothetical protein SVI_3130 [Shewanella violacea DSS12]